MKPGAICAARSSPAVALAQLIKQALLTWNSAAWRAYRDHAGPDGTLSARAVAAVSQLPPGRNVSAHPNGHARDCSPSSIAEALSFGG